MLVALLQAAEEGAEPSKAPFYIASIVLISFAALLSAVGTARSESFPPSRGVARALMLVCAVLVAGTMFTAVVSS